MFLGLPPMSFTISHHGVGIVIKEKTEGCTRAKVHTFPPSRQLLCRLQLAGALLCSCSLKVAHKGIGTVARIQRVCSEPSTDSHSHYRPLWKTIFL